MGNRATMLVDAMLEGTAVPRRRVPDDLVDAIRRQVGQETLDMAFAATPPGTFAESTTTRLLKDLLRPTRSGR